MNTLHLFAPLLLKQMEAFNHLSLPALHRCLNKASVSSTPTSVLHTQAQLFGWDSQTPVPAAALTYLADVKPDVAAAQKYFWLRVDPVHLQPDQQFLRLFDAPVLQLQQPEADVFCQDLNTFYADDPWLEGDAAGFIAARPGRWYLRCSEHLQLHTQTLETVRGLPVHEHLPSGEDARWWHSRWNEIQMFLHQHSLNESREAQGLLTINSLWFWGEGRLPAAPAPRFQQVFAEDALVTGLAHWTQTPHAAVPDHAHPVLQQVDAGDVLCVLPLVQNALEAWETRWFAPVLEALQKKQLSCLKLYAGNGQVYSLKAQHLWYFWRGMKFQSS